MLYPLESAASMLPVGIGVWRYVFALIFAWSLKAAFFEPIAITALAGLYADLARSADAGSAAEKQALRESSPAFAEIEAKAAA
jgi:hypothetical protein